MLNNTLRNSLLTAVAALAILSAGSQTKAQSFGFSGFAVTETVAYFGGGTEVYHVGTLIPGVLSHPTPTTCFQGVTVDVAQYFAVNIPGSALGSVAHSTDIVSAVDLAIAYTVTPGTSGCLITSIHALPIDITGGVSGVDFHFGPASELIVPNNSPSQSIDLTLPGDKIVTFPASNSVSINKDLLLSSLTPTGVASGTSIIPQAVDGSMTTPEPSILAMMAAGSMTGVGFLARRRRK